MPLLSLTWRVPTQAPSGGVPHSTEAGGNWEQRAPALGDKALWLRGFQGFISYKAARQPNWAVSWHIIKTVFGGRSLCDVGGQVIQKESKELGDVAVTKLPCPRLLVHVMKFLCTCVCKNQQKKPGCWAFFHSGDKYCSPWVHDWPRPYYEDVQFQQCFIQLP